MLRDGHIEGARGEHLVVVVVYENVVVRLGGVGGVRVNKKLIPISQRFECIVKGDGVVDGLDVSGVLVGVSVELLDLCHTQFGSQWFVDDLDAYDSIREPRTDLFSAVLLVDLVQHFVGVIDILCLVEPSRKPYVSEPRVVKPVLRVWNAMEIHPHLQIVIVGPLYGEIEVLLSALDVRVVVHFLERPVADGNSDHVQAVGAHELEVRLVVEGAPVLLEPFAGLPSAKELAVVVLVHRDVVFSRAFGGVEHEKQRRRNVGLEKQPATERYAPVLEVTRVGQKLGERDVGGVGLSSQNNRKQEPETHTDPIERQHRELRHVQIPQIHLQRVNAYKPQTAEISLQAGINPKEQYSKREPGQGQASSGRALNGHAHSYKTAKQSKSSISTEYVQRKVIRELVQIGFRRLSGRLGGSSAQNVGHSGRGLDCNHHHHKLVHVFRHGVLVDA